MVLSLILAWITLIFAILTAVKYLARISKNRSVNRFFSKCHIPFGVLLIVTGLLHSILAGNPQWASISDIQVAPVLFTLNWGTGCFILSILLAITYLLRKKLKRRWITAHRILTIFFIGLLVLHLFDVGIKLPNMILGNNNDSGSSQTTQIDDNTSATLSNDNSSVTFSGAKLKDGVYYGKAKGYNGEIAVNVTVSDGAVTAIKIDEQYETPSFFTRAKTVLNSIINEQSLQVDAITGATTSSRALINAVNDALKDAVVSGTLQVNK